MPNADRTPGGILKEITCIRNWGASTKTGAAYERLLGAIGTAEFGNIVRDSVASLTAGARRIYLIEATARDDSSLQYFSGEPGLAGLFPAYRRWFLRQDPLCDAYEAAPKYGDVAMQRIRPAAIASSDFRRRIFDDGGIIERISVIQRGTDCWRVMNVARHASDGYFSEAELDELIGLACLALPMLPLNRKHNSDPLPLTVAALQERFSLQFETLTIRERQVCARAATGMSVEATAIDLGIARTSVLTYRQRAYQKLRVTSPIELCALVAH
jgi:DNA-binding CsgD family transcriptional regulator